ncbi:MAG: YlbD family protein [Clostridium sp.]|nr:YlbD family protein [Clostridium sp.]MCM1444677.1 YlbD family protein [Candidatus Amulumruptor caecigallinarius]
MNKKEEFKEFVRKNPSLISHVNSGNMNWQKYYEIYDLYGEDENAWKDYITKKEEKVVADTATTAGFLTWLKSLDLDSIQNGVESIQRVLSVVGEMGSKDTKKEEYKPRPMYKHFED